LVLVANPRSIFIKNAYGNQFKNKISIGIKMNSKIPIAVTRAPTAGFKLVSFMLRSKNAEPRRIIYRVMMPHITRDPPKTNQKTRG